jgi:hypothetical protein
MKMTLSYGLQNGGGIADSFSHTTGPRLILDLTFFCVVLVVLLNVFLGMIIDTFSSLRADKIERMRDTMEVCFICGIEKQIFDRASDEPDGFKTHIKIDHNMWNYLYFIFLLWEQDRDDDDGLEQYVRRAIDASEITWFPMNKAMRLDRVATKNEVLRKDLKDSIENTQKNVLNRFDDFKQDIHGLMQQLMSNLKQESQLEDVRPADINVYLMDEAVETLEDTNVITNVAPGNNKSNQNYGKHVSVGVKAIHGLNMSQEDLSMISYRIIADVGMFTSSNQGADEYTKTIYFDELQVFPVLDNVQTRDKRIIQIQILHGAASRRLLFVGHIELKAVELLLDSPDAVIDIPFERSAGEGHEHFVHDGEVEDPCILKLVVNSVNAKEYGRPQEA